MRDLQKKGMTPKEIHRDIVQILFDESTFYATERKRVVQFKWGRDTTDDDSRLGLPKTSTTDELVDGINRMVFDTRHLIVSQIAMFVRSLLF